MSQNERETGPVELSCGLTGKRPSELTKSEGQMCLQLFQRREEEEEK